MPAYSVTLLMFIRRTGTFQDKCARFHKKKLHLELRHFMHFFSQRNVMITINNITYLQTVKYDRLVVLTKACN